MEAVNDPALGVVDQLRAAFGAQTPAQIREANAWLESFQGRAEAWQVADQLLAMPLAAGADAAAHIFAAQVRPRPAHCMPLSPVSLSLTTPHGRRCARRSNSTGGRCRRRLTSRSAPRCSRT